MKTTLYLFGLACVATLTGCAGMLEFLASPEAAGDIIDLAVRVATAEETLKTIESSEWTTGEKVAMGGTTVATTIAAALALVQKMRGTSATGAEREARKAAKG